jgi:hypothetical protein
MIEYVLIKGEIITKIKKKMGRGPLKIFFFRTIGPGLTRLSTNHS